MKNQKPLQRKRGAAVGSTALLGLLADIRAAVGDPYGKLMQDELVERVEDSSSKVWGKCGEQARAGNAPELVYRVIRALLGACLTLIVGQTPD